MTTSSRTILLSDFLAEHSLDAANILALRVTLDPRDRCSDFKTLDDLVRANVVGTYERMQNGARLGKDSSVLTFTAQSNGLARLSGFKRFISRRKGIAPGDIVYDYDAAHLFHSFIARARCPVFYDSFDITGLEDMIGKLVIAWPRPLMRSIRRADHEAMSIVNDC
jgi:hypothetical protein